ncbi:toxin biosynthesis protein, putative [Talaromyces stipitatus ATCC 10500]|uniref:Toxin biosynthesis protein, putative n=1 Tax=Talaromyces stipitatus (strain ATCC 10500 / CBS 375.48 / QM 6759 / NRRL 1006) TaxID=441959 RepID=B8LWH3_TALSN|nr:toxin biosynthesis protein, putative [Talaromyces stipitatus ATCC 10500]EED24284.1 toxin biosynthesis protein, putative [Talaromyces stipitatus ATCC 10500]
MSFPFRIVEHVVPGQYLREYPRATSTSQEGTLYLAVKQYIPLDNPHPQAGDVTFIAAHANGFSKELYEPLWEDIYAQSQKYGFKIRSIWMADVAHQGQSGVINENKLGNDPSWFDHSRDLLHLINLKREEMPRPIVGIGHSMGGAQLTYLSLLQPRLIHSLVLLDPVIQRESTQYPDQFKGRYVPTNTILSTHRRDIWPSRKAAAESFKRSPFYKAWNPRVLERWVKYGLRELPTVVYPEQPKQPQTSSEDDDKPVTLTTTRHQEVFTFSRPNYDYDSKNEKPANRIETPDLLPNGPNTYPFYRMEPNYIFSQLPRVRPSVLYIFAGQSFMCTPSMMQDKMDNTGIGQGGSGGVAAGRVKSVYFKDKGHLLAQEAVAECAQAAVEFFGEELQRWKEEEAAFQNTWNKKTQRKKSTVDERWLKEVGPPPVKGAKSTDGNSKPKL